MFSDYLSQWVDVVSKVHFLLELSQNTFAFLDCPHLCRFIAYGAEYLSPDELFQSSPSIGVITQMHPEPSYLGVESTGDKRNDNS